MRHDLRWTTLFGAYLNKVIECDLVSSAFQKELQNKLISELMQVDIWHDPRATRDMVPDEVWEEMTSDPEIAALKRKRAQLKRGTYRIAG